MQNINPKRGVRKNVYVVNMSWQWTVILEVTIHQAVVLQQLS